MSTGAQRPVFSVLNQLCIGRPESEPRPVHGGHPRATAHLNVSNLNVPLLEQVLRYKIETYRQLLPLGWPQQAISSVLKEWHCHLSIPATKLLNINQHWPPLPKSIGDRLGNVNDNRAQTLKNNFPPGAWKILRYLRIKLCTTKASEMYRPILCRWYLYRVSRPAAVAMTELRKWMFCTWPIDLFTHVHADLSWW